MIREKGEILSTAGTKALVAVDKPRDTGHCGICTACSKSGYGKFTLEAENRAGMEKGDRVIIEIDDSAVMKGVFFVYIFPLAGFVIAVLAAGVVQGVLLKISLFVVIFSAFWLLGLKKADSSGKKNRARILNKI